MSALLTLAPWLAMGCVVLAVIGAAAWFGARQREVGSAAHELDARKAADAKGEAADAIERLVAREPDPAFKLRSDWSRPAD